MSSVKKPESTLEARALAQFDSLVSKNELYWEPTEEIKCAQRPFDVYFRISPITAFKPYNPDTKSRKPGFLDDDPEFTLCMVEPAHKLILNKFCWLRPQLILHTREFERQTDDLTKADFEAGLDVLEQIGERYMVIFNGGPDAGSSVAHKHLQVFQRPRWATLADKISAGEDLEETFPFAFTHNNLTDRSPATVYDIYNKALDTLGIRGQNHSMIMTQEWIMIIPRSCATIQGEIENAPMQGGANAMIGMLWLKSEEQYQNWLKYGPMKVLTEFGQPKKPTTNGHA